MHAGATAINDGIDEIRAGRRMTTMTNDGTGWVIEGVPLQSEIVDQTWRSNEPARVTLAGPRLQADRDAKMLRERYGWIVTVEPTTKYGSVEDVVMHETAGGDRWMACPVCKQLAEDVEMNRDVDREPTDPEERAMALHGIRGPFSSDEWVVRSERYTFQPCGDTLITR